MSFTTPSTGTALEVSTKADLSSDLSSIALAEEEALAKADLSSVALAEEEA